MEKIKDNKGHFEWVHPDTLKMWDKNPRFNDHAVPKLMESMKRFGFCAPIVALEDGRILAGETRYKSAKKHRLDRVPVFFVVLDEKEGDLYALVDNRVGEIATWDQDQLAELAVDFSEDDLFDVGFDPADFKTDLEDDKVSERNPELEKYIESRTKMKEREADKCDVFSYAVLVFQSEKQRDSFISEISNVTALYGVYLDGEQFAEQFGISIPNENKKPFRERILKDASTLTIGGSNGPEESNQGGEESREEGSAG